MYCRSCDNPVADGAFACTRCGKRPLDGQAFCSNCGKATVPGAVACPSCGAGLSQGPLLSIGPITAQSRLVVALCAIFLGGLGIHKFLMGYMLEGGIMLAVTVLSGAAGFFTFGLGHLGVGVMGLVGLIEGIIYLTKTDEQFYATYIASKKGWF